MTSLSLEMISALPIEGGGVEAGGEADGGGRVDGGGGEGDGGGEGGGGGGELFAGAQFVCRQNPAGHSSYGW